jgi:5'(3')-deoxyribonucleotidase
MKKPNSLITSLVMLACFALAPRGAWAANTAELLRALEVIEAAMQETRRILEPMDIATLAVQYKEGKLWEDRRQRVMRYTSFIEDRMKKFRHSHDLVNAFLIATSLDELLSNLESFITHLANPTLGDPMTDNRHEWRERAFQWAKDINGHMKLLSETRNTFHDQVITVLDHADARLKACR